MLSIAFKGLEQFAKGLDRFGHKLAKAAARDAVNTTAFEARKVWVGEIQSRMVLRNRFTVNSVRVDKATLGPIDSMQAVLGSLAPYMDEQEFGASQQVGGRRAIPTSAAAGQYGARPRTKLVRRPYRLGAIQNAAKSNRGLNSRQRNAIAMKEARAEGKKFVILENGHGGKNIFRIAGGARNPKLHMMWNLSKGSRPIPKNPTLGPTVSQINHRAPKIYRKAVGRQLSIAFQKKIGWR